MLFAGQLKAPRDLASSRKPAPESGAKALLYHSAAYWHAAPGTSRSKKNDIVPAEICAGPRLRKTWYSGMRVFSAIALEETIVIAAAPRRESTSFFTRYLRDRK